MPYICHCGAMFTINEKDEAAWERGPECSGCYQKMVRFYESDEARQCREFGDESLTAALYEALDDLAMKANTRRISVEVA